MWREKELKIRPHPWEEIVEEGMARIIIPRRELFLREDKVFEPAWAPVFYNPRMKANRDLAVAFARHVYPRGFFFVEPLAGTGVRAVRYAVEAGGEGIANDIDPLSAYYIIRNVVANGAWGRIAVYNTEASSLLHSIRINGIAAQLIDIDPFGSPIPYVDAAARAAARRGYIAVTATDTGPLNCSHRRALLRRYGARCVKADFAREAGLRILIAAIVSRAAAHDVALTPVISYYMNYYYRVYFHVRRRAEEATRLIEENIGYIEYCPSTLDRRLVRERENATGCDEPVYVGPLWIGALGDADHIRGVYDEIHRSPQLYEPRLAGLLSLLLGEVGINSVYINYAYIYRRLRRNMPPILEFIEALRLAGYRAERTHMDPQGVRTDAPIDEVVRIAGSL